MGVLSASWTSVRVCAGYVPPPQVLKECFSGRAPPFAGTTKADPATPNGAAKAPAFNRQWPSAVYPLMKCQPVLPGHRLPLGVDQPPSVDGPLQVPIVLHGLFVSCDQALVGFCAFFCRTHGAVII